MSKTKIFTEVASVILSGADPNGYHVKEDDFDTLTILLKDGRQFGVSGCGHCGSLGIWEDDKPK